MHAQPITFSRSAFNDLTFSRYMDFFGFNSDMNYTRLSRIRNAANSNAGVVLLEQDLYVPYQFFRPVVNLCDSRTCGREGVKYKLDRKSKLL